MTILNITNGNNKGIANQFIITDIQKGVEVFKSYNSVIAVREQSGTVKTQDGMFDYSNTTKKWFNAFLKEDNQKNIEDYNTKIELVEDITEYLKSKYDIIL